MFPIMFSEAFVWPGTVAQVELLLRPLLLHSVPQKPPMGHRLDCSTPCRQILLYINWVSCPFYCLSTQFTCKSILHDTLPGCEMKGLLMQLLCYFVLLPVSLWTKFTDRRQIGTLFCKKTPKFLRLKRNKNSIWEDTEIWEDLFISKVFIKLGLLSVYHKITTDFVPLRKPQKYTTNNCTSEKSHQNITYSDKLLSKLCGSFSFVQWAQHKKSMNFMARVSVTSESTALLVTKSQGRGPFLSSLGLNC